MDSQNRAEQIAELKALRQHYRRATGRNDDDDACDKFEFLGPKVPEATAENPTRMEITSARNDLRVTVTLPADYPSRSPPTFEVASASKNDGQRSSSSSSSKIIITPAHEDAVRELLEEQASYMPGMACVATCLLALDDLDLTSLDLGDPGRRRSIFKVDVVNNSKQFAKSLRGAANGNPCVYYYRTIECQNNAKFSFAVDPWRAVYVACDAPDKKEAVEFMKTIRTDGAMDMDMLGKPGRIQMTVVEEFEMRPKAKYVNGAGGSAFEGHEYRTDEDLDKFMNPFLAAAAGV